MPSPAAASRRRSQWQRSNGERATKAPVRKADRTTWPTDAARLGGGDPLWLSNIAGDVSRSRPTETVNWTWPTERGQAVLNRLLGD